MSARITPVELLTAVAPPTITESARQQIAEGARLLPLSIANLDDYFCGCGDPTEVWRWVLDHLHMLASAKGWPWKPDTGPEYLAVYLLDYLGFTEHGSTIRTPWLMEAGREALLFLDEHGPDWQDKGWWIDAEGVTRSRVGETEP